VQRDGKDVEERKHSARDLSWSFLRLGLTSFGGPVAHLGYFRAVFVARKRWLSDSTFVDLVALCQFLPGPTSSQVAFGIGTLEAGLWGGLAAWAAFTLPSAVLMFLFAEYSGSFGGPVEAAILHGLKVVAVAVVAHAVWSMARSQTPDVRRIVMAFAAAMLALALKFALSQILIIVLGALGGLAVCRSDLAMPHGSLSVRTSSRRAAVMLCTFAILLFVTPLAASISGSQALALFSAFYRSGSLVFGGGHVVLPLLQNAVVAPGWVSPNAFLAGYGAAQALPGPLFSLSTYLGAIANKAPNGIAGAAIALIGISLPGLLLVAGILPFWDRLRAKPKVRAAMMGINASVVGILAAALYNPLWITAISGVADMMLAAAGFALLTTKRVPVLATVALIAGAETVLALV
jgi:chromate transporter